MQIYFCLISIGNMQVLIFKVVKALFLCVTFPSFKDKKELNLYSTAMQSSHIGASRWSRDLMREFHVGDTNMLVSKNAQICVTPNANSKICVTLNANPQSKQVEYRSQWVPNAKFLRWPYTFLLFFGVDLIRVGSCFSVEYGLHNKHPYLVPIC